jgi:hypothetical protein
MKECLRPWLILLAFFATVSVASAQTPDPTSLANQKMWLGRAALGNADAQFWLGTGYEQGWYRLTNSAIFSPVRLAAFRRAAIWTSVRNKATRFMSAGIRTGIHCCQEENDTEGIKYCMFNGAKRVACFARDAGPLPRGTPKTGHGLAPQEYRWENF